MWWANTSYIKWILKAFHKVITASYILKTSFAVKQNTKTMFNQVTPWIKQITNRTYIAWIRNHNMQMTV